MNDKPKTILVHKGTKVSPKDGEMLVDFRGDVGIYAGFTPPYDPADNLHRGCKVTIRTPGKTSTQQFYPSVFGLECILAPVEVAA